MNMICKYRRAHLDEKRWLTTSATQTADSSGLEETCHILIHLSDLRWNGCGIDVSGRGLGCESRRVEIPFNCI